MNSPLVGSFAKVCTEFKIPDRTKNVPVMLKVNVDIESINIQDVREIFFSSTRIN